MTNSASALSQHASLECLWASARGIGEVWEIAPGRGRKAHYDQGQRDRIIRATLQSKPKGMTHWSCRLMAEAQEVSKDGFCEWARTGKTKQPY
jgi:hypothetical protein